MKQWKKVLVAGAIFSLWGTFSVQASTNLETGSSLAGISVALNNYYAGTDKPEEKLASSYSKIEQEAKKRSSASKNEEASDKKAEAQPEAAAETAAQETREKETKAAKSAYDNIAVSKVKSSVNIRTEANTSSGITGKIYNNCAATILDTVDGEGGKWYKIQSGNVTGYIKADYFVTGSQAEQKAKEVGTTYGTVVDTPSLRLRQSPDLTSKTLTLLAEGAQYTVVGEEGDFLKVAVDTDLEGYVFKEYMKTDVKFNEAVSVEEEKAKEAEEAKRKKEAEDAIRELEEAKKAEAKKASEAAKKEETKAPETTAPKKEETKKAETKGTDPVVQTIAANPEKGDDVTVSAPTTAKAEEKPIASKKPDGSPSGGGSSEVKSATRNAIVAYAKQFLGNPYVYGGTSLTKGADCSGFVMSVFSHFGINTGRTSRDQAAKGKAIPVSDVKPGDLLFYASGDYINHVGIYVGGGQIIHASTPATGICYAPSNYRTPCKAVTFLD